jgi:hypothetical protein
MPAMMISLAIVSLQVKLACPALLVTSKVEKVLLAPPRGLQSRYITLCRTDPQVAKKFAAD